MSTSSGSRVGLSGVGRAGLTVVVGLVVVVLMVLLASEAAVGQEVAFDGVGYVPTLSDGASPTDTSVAAVDVAGWGPGEADYVVVAREDVMADALAAAPLLAGGPLVLVPQFGPVPSSVLAVIDRLGVGRVVVVGGPAAVDGVVVDQLIGEGLVVERVWGPSRFATSVAVAEWLVGEGPVDTVVVATIRPPGELGQDLVVSSPDVYAAGGVAGRAGWPLVLTSPGVLPAQTRAFLADRQVGRVVLAGGEAAIGAAVAAEVEGLVGRVERVGGSGRDGTAIALAELLDAGGVPSGVVVVDGVLAAGEVGGAVGVGIAARHDVPVVLVDGDPHLGGVPAGTEALLATAGQQDDPPELVCVTGRGVCGQAREVVAGQSAPQVSVDPPGGLLVAGQGIEVTATGGAEVTVGGSCVDQPTVLVGQGQVVAADPLPDGRCVVTVEQAGSGVATTSVWGFNDPAVPIDGARLDLSPDQRTAEVAMTLQAGDVVAVGWVHQRSWYECYTATLTGPDGSVVAQHVSYACPDPTGDRERFLVEVASSGVHRVTFELVGDTGSQLEVSAGVLDVPSMTVQVDGPPVRVVADRPGVPAQVTFTADAGDLIGIGLDRMHLASRQTAVDIAVRGGSDPTAPALVTLGPGWFYPDSVTDLAPFQVPADGTYTVSMRGSEAASGRVWVSRITPPVVVVDGPPLVVQSSRPGVPLTASVQLSAGQEVSIGSPGVSFCPVQVRDDLLLEPGSRCAPPALPQPLHPTRDLSRRPPGSLRASEAGEWLLLNQRRSSDPLGTPASIYVTEVAPLVIEVGTTLELRHDRPGQITDIRFDPPVGGGLDLLLDTHDMPGCWQLDVYHDLDNNPEVRESWEEFWIPAGPQRGCDDASVFELSTTGFYRPPVAIRFHTFQVVGNFTLTVDQ